MTERVAKKNIIEGGLQEIKSSIDKQIDEYSKLITGYEEAAFLDNIYEEFVVYLSSLKIGVESVVDVMNSTNESV